MSCGPLSVTPLADRAIVDEMFARGHLDAKGRAYALGLLAPRARWGWWVANVLLALGTTLTLTGIVFFFAYNWNEIPPLAKLGIVQGAMALCLVGAVTLTLRRLVGQTLLLAASVLVGVFWAVFGQIYQTGADAWQLFAVWLLLITPWTAISRFAAQWVAWLVLANVTLVLWWDQDPRLSVDLADMMMSLSQAKDISMEYMLYVVLILLNGSALMGIEWLRAKGHRWLQNVWIGPLVLTGVLWASCFCVLAWIVEDSSRHFLALNLVGPLGLLAHGPLFAFYRSLQPRLWAVALIVLSVCIMAEAGMIKMLTTVEEIDDASRVFQAGVFTLIIFGAAIAYLGLTQKALRRNP